MKKDRSAWPSSEGGRPKGAPRPDGQKGADHRPTVPPPLKKSKTPTKSRRGR
jgi:hypothetical protein